MKLTKYILTLSSFILMQVVSGIGTYRSACCEPSGDYTIVIKTLIKYRNCPGKICVRTLKDGALGKENVWLEIRHIQSNQLLKTTDTASAPLDCPDICWWITTDNSWPLGEYRVKAQIPGPAEEKEFKDFKLQDPNILQKFWWNLTIGEPKKEAKGK